MAKRQYIKKPSEKKDDWALLKMGIIVIFYVFIVTFIINAYFVEKKNLSKMSIVAKDERKKMQFIDWGATYYSLTNDLPNPVISFLEVELDPGIARPEETSTHDGEEFALVTKGVMEIIIGDEKFILKEGDSIHYKSNKPHAMRNIGDAKCRAIWVTMPPYSL